MATTGGKNWWQNPFILSLVIICSAIPLLATSFPPLIDLPAHFSRYYVQEFLDQSPYLSRYYDFTWRFIPNLGVDLLIIPLTKVVGLERAVSLVVSAIPALTCAGMLWIAREAHGRMTPTAFAALPLAYSYPLIYGFVNYCLSVALALIALGLWLRLSGRNAPYARTAAFIVIAPAILVAHVLGYGVLGVLVGGAAVAANLSSGKPPLQAVLRAILVCLPLAWPIVLLILWQDATTSSSSGWLDWHRRLVWLGTMLRERLAWFDIASALVAYGFAVLPILFRKRFSYSLSLAIPAGLLWMLAFALPTNVFGSDYASVRMMPIACALMILAVRPTTAVPPWLAPLALSFFALRLAYSTFNMTEAERQFERELEALDHVAPGSRIASFVTFECRRIWMPPRFQHLTSFATSRREAFVNDQFSRTEGQLLSIKDQPGNSIRPMPISYVMSSSCEEWHQRSLQQALQEVPWSNVDYLWLVNVPNDQIPRSPNLRPIRRNEHSILFRVPGPAS